MFLYLARCDDDAAEVDDDTEGGDVVDMADRVTSEEKSSCCPSLGEEICIRIFFTNSP